MAGQVVSCTREPGQGGKWEQISSLLLLSKSILAGSCVYPEKGTPFFFFFFLLALRFSGTSSSTMTVQILTLMSDRGHFPCPFFSTLTWNGARSSLDSEYSMTEQLFAKLISMKAFLKAPRLS